MIEQNVKTILKSLGKGITLVAATKGRSPEQIKEAIGAGITIIGENYVQEARAKFPLIGKAVNWHFIGHLQKNKVKYVVDIFDMIETVDSLALAQVLDEQCRKINKVMPVLIEINSACEPQKHGVLPEKAHELLKAMASLPNIRPMGLMTMGPWLEDQETLRPYFLRTRQLFDDIRQACGQNPDWKYLSMGMSESYKLAIEAGANMVRIGAAIFGPRETKHD